MLDLLSQNPLAFVLLAVVLILSLSLHEWGHAYAAHISGDDTAKNLGRLSLNPLKHLDPLGSILIVLVGFGWAKPVPVMPSKFRNLRQGTFLVAIAGVCMNLLIALVAIISIRALGFAFTESGGIQYLPQQGASPNEPPAWIEPLLITLFFAARINILLIVLNLIPVPPLDGSRVVQSFAPDTWWRTMREAERYGLFVVLAIFIFFPQQIWQVADSIFGWLTRFIFSISLF